MSENGHGAEWTNLEALEAAIGELREAEEECPSVRYVSTYGGGVQKGHEFYVVARDAEIISNEAKTYGTDIPGCPGYLLYPMDTERQVRKIIQYEMMRYRMREGVPDEDRETLRETALDGMEECPAYFGAFPPPSMTPYGHTVRYKVLMNGAFWIQTDAPAAALAVAYPIRDDAFSEYAMPLAEGDADGFGYLFFPERAICLAVFELGRTYPAMRACPLIDAARTGGDGRDWTEYRRLRRLVPVMAANQPEKSRAGTGVRTGNGNGFASFHCAASRRERNGHGACRDADSASHRKRTEPPGGGHDTGAQETRPSRRQTAYRKSEGIRKRFPGNERGNRLRRKSGGCTQSERGR